MSNPHEFTRNKPDPKKRSKARNRVISTETSKASKIKLLLHEKGGFRKAIRHALDNSYRWTPFNIHEIREYMEDVENNLNPVTPEILASVTDAPARPEIYMRYYHEKGYSAREIYRDHRLEWKSPNCFYWLHRILALGEISQNNKNLRLKYYTTKEWFKEFGLELPQILEPDSNMVITTRKDLERTGIFEDLDHKIKEALDIEDELEKAYHNWDSLDVLEKDHIKILINTKAVSKNHPYYILLKENIAQE